MKENKRKTRNVWRIVSIAFILMFFLIIIGSAVKVHHFKASFSIPTEEQISSAKDIVAQELEENEEDINIYEVNVASRVRKINKQALGKNIIQVSLFKDSIRKSYLVDTGSGEIVMRSETEFFSWMKDWNKKKQYDGKNIGSHKKRWFARRGFAVGLASSCKW